MRTSRSFSMILLLTAAITFSGCGLVSAGRLSEKEVLPGGGKILPQSDVVTADTDPARAIDAAYKKLCEVRSYRTRTELKGPTGAIAVTTAEFVKPDRRRAVQMAGTDAEFETITIGPRTYQRSAGKWTEMKGPLSNAYADPGFMCSNEPPPSLPANLPQPKLEPAGSGEVNGARVIMFRSAVAQDGPGGSHSMIVTTSIGASDGKLYRTESRSSGSGLGDITTTTTYSDYDAEIRIEPPV